MEHEQRRFIHRRRDDRARTAHRRFRGRPRRRQDRLLTDVRRFDDERGWARHGALSCAHWLSWRCGIELGAGREKVRVAHALAALPVLDEAFRCGQVSYSKVRAITRVATAESEVKLVDMARHATAAQLEKICRRYAQCRPRPEGTPEPERWVRTHETSQGMVRIDMQLRPEEAARLLQAIDASAGSAGTRPDGIAAMAEGILRGDRPDRPPVELLVHIDAATLTGHHADAGIPAETARRLLCDAGVVPILEDAAGTPLDVGRKTRTFSPALRRALIARDGGCRFPGCTNRRFVDGHHIRHWADGGETSLENAISLCTRHHFLIHEGGFTMTRDDRGAKFFPPAGAVIAPAGLPPGRAPALPVVAAPAPGWDGDPVDFGAAIECLV